MPIAPRPSTASIRSLSAKMLPAEGRDATSMESTWGFPHPFAEFRYPVPVKASIAVMGGGAWGTALAAHSARLGHDVRLWAREDDVVRDVLERHENALFLE